MKILVAVLAAGYSSRFGSNKLEAKLGGKPLARWAFDAAVRLGEHIVWVGRGAAPAFVASDDRAEYVSNYDADHGLSSSVRLAAKIAEAQNAERLLLILADMPLITTELLQALIDAGPTAACEYPGRRLGVPVVLPASAYGALMSLSGDKGASHVLTTLRDLRRIAPDPAQLWDIDTADDLLLAQLGSLKHDRSDGSPEC